MVVINGKKRRKGLTDVDGRYSFDNLKKGEYEVSLFETTRKLAGVRCRFKTCSRKVKVKKNKVNNVDFKSKPISTIVELYDLEYGELTAYGEFFDSLALGAASATLPPNTYVRISNQDHQVLARVNDRGPFISKKINGKIRKVPNLARLLKIPLGVYLVFDPFRTLNGAPLRVDIEVEG